MWAGICLETGMVHPTPRKHWNKNYHPNPAPFYWDCVFVGFVILVKVLLNSAIPFFFARQAWWDSTGMVYNGAPARFVLGTETLRIWRRFGITRRRFGSKAVKTVVTTYLQLAAAELKKNYHNHYDHHNHDEVPPRRSSTWMLPRSACESRSATTPTTRRPTPLS